MLEDFLWWVAGKKLAQWCLSVRLSVCLSVSPFKHFGTWSMNGWADRDRRGTIRRARAAERQWCQLQSDWCHVVRATCQCAIPCKKVVAQGAGQAKERIPHKLCMSIAKMGGHVPLSNQRWRPIGRCHRHVPIDFVNWLMTPERLARSGPGRCQATQFNVQNTAKSIA